MNQSRHLLRRDKHKRVSVHFNTVLLSLFFVTVLFYGRTLRKLTTQQLHRSSTETGHDLQSREPVLLLRHIQSELIQTNIIPTTSTTTKPIIIEHTTTTTTTSTSTSTSTTTNDDDDDNYYYIIFDADIPGQGIGNLISGLLAAHLLGDEFHRIVCINPIYFSIFTTYFESIQPIVITKCPIILQQITEQNATTYYQQQQQNEKHMITIINFLGAVDECYIQQLMSDRTKRIIHFVGNTYPRWPSVPNNYFLHYYQPKSILLQYLPYQYHPRIVVHLREPDDITYDPRLGLDNSSLTVLGETLPKTSETFLVTNNVEYYNRFVTCCSWSHAHWDNVEHSAMHELLLLNNYDNHNDGPKHIQQQNLQMWSDWYTLLMADTIYHTHSDFSISAIHWMNNHNSYSILGYNTITKQLDTQEESWWRDGETIPLVQRTIKGKPGTTNELRACAKNVVPL